MMQTLPVQATISCHECLGFAVCLSVEEWRARFPNCGVSEQKQFAHDLVRHITQLHEADRLTADFLQIAVSSLGKSLELDTAFRALVVDALKCLEAQAVAVPSMREAFARG